MKAIVAVCLLYASLTSEAFSADKGGNFMVLGQGTVSCGKWTELRKGSDWYPEAGWILGYLSSYNELVWTKQNVADSTDAAGISAWVDGYCAVHPLNNLSNAARRITQVLAVKSAGGKLTNEYGD